MAEVTNPPGLTPPEFAPNGFLGAMLTICQCLRITRTDSVVLGFTTHDRDLVIDGIRYKANSAFFPLAANKSADLAVDEQNVSGYLNDEGIRDDDIMGGRYSNAVIEYSFVDWNNLPATLEEGKEFTSAVIGQITLTDSNYQIEIIGEIESKLRAGRVKVYQPTCRHRLGHDLCTVSLGPFTINTDLATVTDEKNMGVSSGTPSTTDLRNGEITFTSGLNAGIRRDITAADGSTITLLQGLPYVPEVGDSCTVIYGCNKTWEECRDKFNNTKNFSGIPTHGNFMPGQRPYTNPKTE